MTRHQLWQHITSRNPGMLSGQGMTPESYRKLFDLVWDQATKEARDKQIPDFAEIFGKMRRQ